MGLCVIGAGSYVQWGGGTPEANLPLQGTEFPEFKDRIISSAQSPLKSRLNLDN